jgi:hypothetical protein
MQEIVSKFRKVFNFKDPDAKGRCCVLIFKVVEGFLTYITTGIFYTDFLQGYDMSSVSAGILAFIPYIASMFVLFTPALLNRFPKRKWILAACKFLYYFVILVGLNLLPNIVTDDRGRLWGMIIITFLASLFNVVATAGYAAWHIRFQPEEIRAYFLSVCLFLTALVSGVLTLASGLITDLLREHMSPEAELTFLVCLRYFAFALGVVNVIFLLLPREVEYPVIHAPRFTDIFSIPSHNKKFMLTMGIVFLWQFSAYCYSAQLNYYLLNVINMSMTFYNIIIFLYSVFFIFCMNFWQKMIRRTSWFFVFAVALLIVAPFQILYGFVQPGHYILLVLIVRLPQHFAGVGHNVAFDNFQYINMPATNRECYTSFYQIVFNLGALAGYVFGTVFDANTQDWSFTAFGYTYTSGVPFLIMLCGVVEFIIAALVLIFRRHLEPDRNAAQSA